MGAFLSSSGGGGGSAGSIDLSGVGGAGGGGIGSPGNYTTWNQYLTALTQANQAKNLGISPGLYQQYLQTYSSLSPTQQQEAQSAQANGTLGSWIANTLYNTPSGSGSSLTETSTSPSSGTPGSEGSAANDTLANIYGQLITTPPFTNQSSIPGIGGSTSTSTTSSRPGAPQTVASTGAIGTALSKLGLSPATANLLGQLISGAGAAAPGVFGAIQANNQQNWNNAAKVSTLNNLAALQANAQGQIGGQSNTYLPQMASQIETSQGLLNSTQNQLSGNINNALGNVNGAFNNSKDPFATVPGLQDIISQLNGIQGSGTSAASNLQNNLTSGPLTGGLTNAENISSGNTPIQGQLSSLAAMLTGNPNALGGPNAATQQAQNAAGSILGTNPLLSMGQVQSMAIDQNATQSLNAEKQLRQQELNRTGVTGPAIASGAQDELLGSGMDQALQNQASGLTNATLGQQALQNQLYNTGASLFGTAQNAGLNTQQLALQQLLGGAGLLSGNQNSQISALNALSSLGGTQNQGYSSLSGLLNTLSGSFQGAGSLLNNASTLGNTQTNDLYTQLNNLLSQQSTLSGQAGSNLFSAANFPQNIVNQNQNLLQTLASGQVGLFGNVPAMTTSNNLFSNLTS